MSKVKSALVWVRAHKVQVATLTVVGVGLAEGYVPGFPADAVVRVVGALLGMA